MQLTEFSREFGKARWGLDVLVCIAAAVSLPFLIGIWTFPLDASPVTFSGFMAGTAAIAFAYLLSSLLGKWIMRISSWSFVWVAAGGSVLYAIVRVIEDLPAAIDYHNRFVADSTLTVYLISYSVPTFILVVLLFGGFSLIASSFVRILLLLCSARRSI